MKTREQTRHPGLTAGRNCSPQPRACCSANHEPLLFAYGENDPASQLSSRLCQSLLQSQDGFLFGGIDAANSLTLAWDGRNLVLVGQLVDDGWRIRPEGRRGSL